MATRSVMVDDSSPDFTYHGSQWFVDQGSLDLPDQGTPVYNNTLHGTTESAYFSYSFEGSMIDVRGTNIYRNDTGWSMVTVDCYVDNFHIGSTSSSTSNRSLNNFQWCFQEGMLETKHILEVYAAVPKNQTFWFDWLVYVPTAGASLESKIVFISKEDPNVNYVSDWRNISGYPKFTTQHGAGVIFQFIGTSLSWYGGSIPENMGNSPTTGSYSIDGHSPTVFNLKNYPQNSQNFQKFFETPTLPMGQYNLSVVFNGNNQTVPLSLDFFLVQNGTLSTNTSSSTTDIPLLPSTSPSNKQQDTPLPIKIAVIVGSIAGVLLVLAFTLWYVCRLERNRKQRRKAVEDEDGNGPSYVVETFDYRSIPQNSSPPPLSYYPSPFATWYSSSQPQTSEEAVFLDQDVEESVASVYAGIAPSQSGSIAHLPPSIIPTSPPEIYKQPRILRYDSDQGTSTGGFMIRNPSSQEQTLNRPVLLHADSGLRMPREVEKRPMVEIPPQYTAG